VVPCCLDHNADIPLGNVFNQPLTQILSSPRAAAMREGFAKGQLTEDLCRRCGYISRFSKSSKKDGRHAEIEPG
jgi:sulfatase maturation enzyme AslB (radical SAM superfamily)